MCIKNKNLLIERGRIQKNYSMNLRGGVYWKLFGPELKRWNEK